MSTAQLLNDITSVAPVVDDTRIEAIWKEIDRMPLIMLDPDPLASGPSQMNSKRAAIRNQLSRCTTLELQVLKDMGWYQTRITKQEAMNDLTLQDLLASNPKVRAQRSSDDRKALAETQMSEDIMKLQHFKMNYVTLDSIRKVLQTKKMDLKNLQQQLKEQMKACEHELGLGRPWGVTQQAVGGDALLNGLDALEGQLPTPTSVFETNPRSAPEGFTASAVVDEDLDLLLEGGSSQDERVSEGVSEAEIPEKFRGRTEENEVLSALDALGGDEPESVVTSKATEPSEGDLSDLDSLLATL